MVTLALQPRGSVARIAREHGSMISMIIFCSNGSGSR
ncbi:TPA: hypothetical protein ACWZ08_004620 [Escherichia coli]|nr:hypothetical protein [Escherichia coli]